MLQMLNRQSGARQPQQTGNNPMQMIQQFQQFAKSMTPEGAKTQVEQLLQSGQMTQEQFKQFAQIADKFVK